MAYSGRYDYPHISLYARTHITHICILGGTFVYGFIFIVLGDADSDGRYRDGRVFGRMASWGTGQASPFM